MIGKALKLIRTSHEMKQSELAGQLSISKSYLSEIENGLKSPSIKLVDQYALIFKIPASSILFFSEQIESSVESKSRRQARQMVSEKVLALLQFIDAKRRSDDGNED